MAKNLRHKKYLMIIFSAFEHPEHVGSILAETVKNETLTHLYIAAPFDDADLISRIISAIPKQIKVFYGDDMEKPRILL